MRNRLTRAHFRIGERIREELLGSVRAPCLTHRTWASLPSHAVIRSCSGIHRLWPEGLQRWVRIDPHPCVIGYLGISLFFFNSNSIGGGVACPSTGSKESSNLIAFFWPNGRAALC